MPRRRHGSAPATSPPNRRAHAVAIGAAATGLLTAAVVALAGGGEAFWVCLPVALGLTAASDTARAGALGAAGAVAAGFAPAILTSAVAPPPSTALALLVPAASVAVLMVVRERLVDQREALRVSASTDPLTGVANRRSLLGRIDYEVARHRRSRGSFALLMLDLDGFKQLNDRFGHAAGDDLLVEVAAAVQSAIRDQDTVARIGGDEFCVLAPETDTVGARQLAARVMTAVGRVTAGVESLGASPGLAIFPHDGATAAHLLQTADEQLLAVKRRRHGRVQRRAA